MIVWGGLDYSDSLVNTGGRYNPATDSWLPTSTGANVPTGRYQNVNVWTGLQLIVWGGSHTGTYDAVNTGGRYWP
jgi:hypothetical protein